MGIDPTFIKMDNDDHNQNGTLFPVYFVKD